MNEYNFDPMTGEPIPGKENTPNVPRPQEPVPETPAPENPVPEVSVPETPASPAEEPAQPGESAAGSSGYDTAAFGDSSRPTESQPVYHYARPKETPAGSYAGGPSSYAYQAPPVPPQRPERGRAVKTVTTGKFYSVIAIVLVLALALGLGGGYLGARYLAPASGAAASGTAVIYKTTKLQSESGDTVKTELTIPEVAELVKNSVVEITTEKIVTGSFMQQYVSEGAGSGVIITADGYIVTNHHVIDGATNINVRLADGTEYKATLIGTDSKADLAVIKIEASGLTPAAYGSSSELKVGETVVAIGNPLGQLGGTVTQGIISALDREITIDNTTMSLLQTDTAINPGNSGGGMFNTSGQLVGIVNAKSAGEEIEGLGFAIPIDTAKKVIEDLIQHGYVTGRVDPGFTFVEVNDAMTAMMYRVSEMGLYISQVASGSDGEKAGFKSGDYVVSIDGTAVTTATEANAIIDGKTVGDTMTLVIRRSGAEQTISMELTEYIPSMTNTNNTSSSSNPFGLR
ncbi:MAG: serine protease HtrA [Clostridiales bacterium]|nr:MAG: serine protease HtrA [Clostridiales bacterium]